MPNPVPLPDNLAVRIRAAEDRLDRLERGDRTTLGMATAAGLPLLSILQTGWEVPVLTHPWRRAGDEFATTSASFVTAYRTNVRNLLGDGIQVSGFVIGDAATTGELRLNLFGVGTTSAFTILASATVPFTFKWDFPGGPVGSITTQLDVEIRRTGGAGSVHVLEPDPLIIATSIPGITTTGL